ncbi:prepilin-type N-terminal cleavage/methylation domain-containing protein [Proteobacteria bacterium 005FR1]|nr:prepilin-type N-terminal cleavage/methylation domain-containing protein [Proteobacteria bacterium 005FR1]
MQAVSKKKVDQKGFTLIEVMIVVAVIAIIAAIALPSYNSSVIKSKRAMGKAELLEVLARQEQHFINNKAYATNLTSLGYGANPYLIDDQGNETAANAIYQIALAAGASTTAFTLQAIPQNAQADDAECATLQISNTGLKTISGGTSTAASCW